jgi:recombination protein RecA
MKYLDDVTKQLEKAGIHVGSSEPPRYWFSTGNYVVNKIISGSFHRGIPQGRLTAFAGPSGAGKSFLAANVIKSAQAEGSSIVVLDSENALDDNFVSAVGVDPTHEDYTYIAVDTIANTKKIVSAVVTGYVKEYGDEPTAPKVLIVIDSLDMLMTDTETENFSKGISKGDQGQRTKQLKAMLREFVQAVKRPNISIVVTCQVYKNQDVLNGEGVWIVTPAVKFSLSQILLLTKLKLKDVGSRDVKGIRMKVEGYKTRFTKPYQVVTIEVPYDQGMDPYNGLLPVGVELGLVEKRGSRYSLTGQEDTWYSKDFDKHAEHVLALAEGKREKFLEGLLEEAEEDTATDDKRSSKVKRQDKATK